MLSTRVRSPLRALFWRLFLINGLVFVTGTLALAFSPATGALAPLAAELPILLGGLALIIVANALLVRASLSPLKELTAVMQRVESVGAGERVEPRAGGDFGALVRSFNEMLDRLETERSLSSAQALSAQEGERQRIAQELHDEVGQSLTVALLGLKRVVAQTPGDLREEASMAQEAVRSSLEDVRRVAHRLRPDVLVELGLQSALRSLTSEFSAAGDLDVVPSVDVTLPRLSDAAELVLYRVAQESLTNVARHAHATRAAVSLTASADAVTLRVTDDGPAGSFHFQEGAGIRGMRERALLVRARLDIGAAPEGGTEVLLRVPTATRGS